MHDKFVKLPCMIFKVKRSEFYASADWLSQFACMHFAIVFFLSLVETVWISVQYLPFFIIFIVFCFFFFAFLFISHLLIVKINIFSIRFTHSINLILVVFLSFALQQHLSTSFLIFFFSFFVILFYNKLILF